MANRPVVFLTSLCRLMLQNILACLQQDEGPLSEQPAVQRFLSLACTLPVQQCLTSLKSFAVSIEAILVFPQRFVHDFLVASLLDASNQCRTLC